MAMAMMLDIYTTNGYHNCCVTLCCCLMALR